MLQQFSNFQHYRTIEKSVTNLEKYSVSRSWNKFRPHQRFLSGRVPAGEMIDRSREREIRHGRAPTNHRAHRVRVTF